MALKFSAQPLYLSYSQNQSDPQTSLGIKALHKNAEKDVDTFGVSGGLVSQQRGYLFD